MILGSMPYVRFVQLLNGQSSPLWQDSQVRAYLRWIAYAVGSVTLWRVFTTDMHIEDAFREALFNLVSIMSSTGFASGSFAAWGGYAFVVAFVLGVIGACSGSSAAGLSVFRVQLAAAALLAALRQTLRPNRVDPVRYEGKRVDGDVIDGLILFIFGFISLLGLCSVALTLTGVDSTSALWAVWTSLGNIGYGIGPMLARTGTFIDFPDAAVWILSAAMLLGRLGLLAILVVLLPRFWRA
jgi:trk system potassium uptake protein TrkH